MTNDRRLDKLIALLPVGRAFVVSAKELAFELECDTRTVGSLVERAIVERGYAVGSLCGERPGYFLIADADDLEAGAAHTVRRAVASLRRVRALRRNYEALTDSPQTALFDALDEVAS